MKRAEHPLTNKRVQVPVWTDTWMRGDRFGKVVHVSIRRATEKPIAHVFMDKSKRTIQFLADDCDEV